MKNSAAKSLPANLAAFLRRGLALLTTLQAIASSAHTQPGCVWAWGQNGYGQLGNGHGGAPDLPTKAEIADVLAIASGDRSSYALRSGGSVWAWGSNLWGSLGDGTTQDRWLPVRTLGLSDVIAIACGAYHGLALTRDGTVWAWGSNWSGELGDGTTVHRYLPAPVPGVSDVVAISAGAAHSLVLCRNGSMWAWGLNRYGQLGDGTTVDSPIPVLVLSPTSPVAVSAGREHNLALLADGSVLAWGGNAHGQLGDGTTVNRSIPQPIPNLPPAKAIKASNAWLGEHSMALARDGLVWTWGANDAGQLGDGTNTDRASPAMLSELAGVARIALGGRHSLAASYAGAAWAWGDNTWGQLGVTGGNHLAPQQIPSLPFLFSLAGAENHSLALEGSSQYPITGRATLKDFASSAADVSLDCAILTCGRPFVHETHTVQLESDGRFSVPSTLTGVFDLRLKASHWLGAIVPATTIGPTGLSGLSVQLWNGDVNGDNTVSIADFLVLRAAYGSTSSSANWNPNADLNGDGGVGVADFLVLRQNFGRSGE